MQISWFLQFQAKLVFKNKISYCKSESSYFQGFIGRPSYTENMFENEFHAFSKRQFIYALKICSHGRRFAKN